MKLISYAVVLCLAFSIVVTGCSSKKEAENNQETQITETEKEEIVEEETEDSHEDDDDGYGNSEKDDDDFEFSAKSGDDDGNVSVDYGTKAQWPKDVPSFFPKLNGKIVGVIETSEDNMVSYTVMFDEIKSKGMDAFIKRIEAKPGWTIISKTLEDDVWIVMAMNEKNESHLMVTVEDGESGGMMITFKR
ncbi:MAG: hypothetical protein KAH01_05595 [Caldisericia bacterium]|nr:hypothetical protein [Caldisericia bacterium]